MYFARRSLLPLLLIAIVLTSCGSPAAAQPTQDVNGTIAAGAQTFAASFFLTQTAVAPTITNTVPPTVTLFLLRRRWFCHHRSLQLPNLFW
jgi:hypothetical protein